MRKPKIARVNLYGVEAAAETKALAKQQAEAEVTERLSRLDMGPHLYRVLGKTILVWPASDGWTYRILEETKTGADGKLYSPSTGDATFGEAVRRAAACVAQDTWSRDVYCDAAHIRSVLACFPPGVMLAYLVSDFLVWANFQRDYKRLRDLGATDADAHWHAGRNDGWVPQEAAA